MNDAKLVTLEQLRGFLAGAADLGLTPTTDPAARYGFIKTVLKRFKYPLQYTRKFTPEDIGLLAELDSLHGTLSGPATRVLLQRACHLFGQARYERLATISVAHLYNLRAQPLYQQRRVHFTKTQTRPSRIGIRRAPAPAGRPGFIRIDTVHQGDLDGRKGLYHINAVDIVTQWQLVASCERISEAYLLPVIGELLAGFPFEILGFHSDGGSEYLNHDVAKLLEKLRVEFTRSRPRHTNDNALVESKNGSVIRKQFGYAHIAQHFADDMNAFCREFLNPYVNFHRPCYFAVDDVDAKGKIRKRYPHLHDGADGARVFLDGARRRSRVPAALEARDDASRGGHPLGDFRLRHSCGATGGHEIGDQHLQRLVRLELASVPVRVPGFRHECKAACQDLVAVVGGGHDDWGGR